MEKIFLDETPIIEIKAGMVYIQAPGQRVGVMSLATFRRYVETGIRLLNEYESTSREPIPLCKVCKRGH